MLPRLLCRVVSVFSSMMETLRNALHKVKQLLDVHSCTPLDGDVESALPVAVWIMRIYLHVIRSAFFMLWLSHNLLQHNICWCLPLRYCWWTCSHRGRKAHFELAKRALLTV